MAGVDLCDLADVRGHSQYQASATEHDEVIGSLLIPSVSRAIAREVKRELSDAGAATRTITFDPRDGKKLGVSPWDLRTVTAVVLDQGRPGEQTLTAAQYRLSFHDRDNGVWRGVELDQAYPVSGLFSERSVTITGTWGFAEVPDDVREACVLAVIMHLRRDVQAFGGSLQPNSFGDGVNDAVAFSPGVRGLLEPFRFDLYA